MYRYFQNPFMNVTANNFKKMMLMARDHRDKLLQYTSDPDIQNLYNTFNTAFTSFENAYSEVNSNMGYYKGHTRKVETLINELMVTKIRQWDIWIQNVYLDDTPEYAMLLPQNRKPFQNGAYELKIDAVRTLSKTLDRFPNLANIKADVEIFYNKLNEARTAQQQAETLDQSLRQNLEECRVNLALFMHHVFGFLLYKHYKNPADMSRYYELKYLQAPVSSSSVSLSRYNISANSRITLFDGLLTANSYITLKNTGATTLKIFTTADKNAIAADDVMELSVGDSYSFYANELTDNSGFNWLIIINEASNEGKLEAGKEDIAPE